MQLVKQFLLILGHNILNIDPIILSILLKDRTTNKNIIWATDNYKAKGFRYGEDDPISMRSLVRTQKVKEQLTLENFRDLADYIENNI